ncbi:hypothetical protein C6499_22895 [Candidatus Poribacteria bacterium]|nr:MAG: hypothetical protein C6499_22895 [Candidatus Poribacteria bacterium]
MGMQVIGKDDAAADDVGNIGTVVFGLKPDTWGTDAYTINAATLQDDTLTINVSYGGGCETHAFTLVAEQRFLESFPVQLRVSLAHNANSDTCKALITEDYTFDLTPIKETYQKVYRTDEGTVALRLKDAPPSGLFYDF